MCLFRRHCAAEQSICNRSMRLSLGQFSTLLPDMREPSAMNRNLHVVFSKAEGDGLEYSEVARGDWTLGREPVLTGEAIPPEVLKGIEKQMPAACEHSTGTVRYARAEVLYAMDFEAMDK